MQAPEGAGAISVNVHSTQLDAPMSEPHTLLPSDRIWTVEVPSDAAYTIVWRPIGGRATKILVPPGDSDFLVSGFSSGEQVAEIRGESSVALINTVSRNIRSVGALRQPPAEKESPTPPREVDVWKQLQGKVAKFAKRNEGVQDLRVPPPSLQWEKLTSIRVEQPLGEFSIGVASDSTPRRYGGWKPYFGRWPIQILRAYGRVTLRFPRGFGETVDPEGLDGSRVRISLGVDRKRLRRFLAPLYAGGVDVTMRSSGIAGDDLTFEVTPCDSELSVLVQALSVANAKDARAIESEVRRTTERYMADVRSAKIHDPWMAIVLGMTIKRHRWTEQCDWSVDLAGRFPWVTDTLVLAAWWCSTKRGGLKLEQTLEYLSRARKRGSLYLTESNATMRDLLVWLSSEAPDEEMRTRARRELALWRTNVPFQTWGGANFAWVVEKAPTTGRIPGLSDRIVMSGKLDEFIGSQDPNKGKFGELSARNGRVVKASVARTGDPEFFAISIEVRSTDPARTLTGPVELHLHPTFHDEVRRVTASNGVAKLDIRAWGAFTLGVICDGGKTKLELDLAEDPEAPALFRSR